MEKETTSLNFLEQIIEKDLKEKYTKDQLRFRFPPEPNGYLHIGHASSICLNFGIGEKYNAPVNMRFDNTNTLTERKEYVDAIQREGEWMGLECDQELYNKDYFKKLYNREVVHVSKVLT